MPKGEDAVTSFLSTLSIMRLPRKGHVGTAAILTLSLMPEHSGSVNPRPGMPKTQKRMDFHPVSIVLGAFHRFFFFYSYNKFYTREI